MSLQERDKKNSLHPNRISCSGITVYFKYQFSARAVITLV